MRKFSIVLGVVVTAIASTASARAQVSEQIICSTIYNAATQQYETYCYARDTCGGPI